jgi:hypothetical protein
MLRKTSWSQDVDIKIKCRTKSDISDYEYGFHFYVLLHIFTNWDKLLQVHVLLSTLHPFWTAYILSIYTIYLNMLSISVDKGLPI